MKTVGKARQVSQLSPNALIIALVSIIPFFSRVRIEPNPLHDGYVYSAALATTQGLVPNRDFFSQYGPLFPYIQGVFLDIFGNQVTSLRIANALLLTAIAVLFYKLCLFKLSPLRSFLVVLLWVSGISAGWTTLLPWVNVLTTFIVLLAIFLMKISLGNTKSLLKRKFCFLVSGSLISTIPFLRIQTIPILGISIILSYLFLKESRNPLTYFNFGLFFGLISLVTIFQALGALVPYIEQCLIWPFTFYKPQNFTLESLAPNFYFLFVPIFWILLRKLVRSNLYFSLSVATVLLISIFYTRNNELSYLSISHPDILLNNILNSILGTLFFAVVFLGIGAIWNSLKFIGDKSRFSKTLPGIGIIVLGLSQLYPAWDPAHIWWITPLVIIGIIEITPLSKCISFLISYQALLVGLISVGLLSAGLYQFHPREEFHSRILQGMVASKETRSAIDENLIQINRIKSGDLDIKFDCPDGLYAVSDGEIHDSRPVFVNWGPVELADDETFEGLFVCNQSSEYIQEYFLNTYTVEEKLPSVDYLDKNNWILVKSD